MQLYSIHTTTFVTTATIFLTVLCMGNNFHNDLFGKIFQFYVQYVRDCFSGYNLIQLKCSFFASALESLLDRTADKLLSFLFLYWIKNKKIRKWSHWCIVWDQGRIHTSGVIVICVVFLPERDRSCSVAEKLKWCQFAVSVTSTCITSWIISKFFRTLSQWQPIRFILHGVGESCQKCVMGMLLLCPPC